LSNKQVDASPIISALHKALQDKQDSVRNEAAKALGEFGARAAATVPTLCTTKTKAGSHIGAVYRIGYADPTALTRAIPHKNHVIRFCVLLLLTRLSHRIKQRHIKAIIPALRDPSAGIRAFAANNLYVLGPRAKWAAPKMLPLLKDKSPFVRSQAILTLQRMNVRSKAILKALSHSLLHETPKLQEKAWNTLVSLDACNKDVASAYGKLLHHKQASFRQKVARQLGNCLTIEFPTKLTQEITKSLFARLHDKDEFVRRYTAETLGKWSQTESKIRKALIDMLQQKQVQARTNALRALAKAGPMAWSAVPTLIRIMADKRSNIRYNTVRTLGAIGPQAAAAIPTLLKHLGNHGQPYVQGEIAETLGKINKQPKRTIPALVWAAKHRYGLIRSQAMIGLGRLTFQDKRITATLLKGLQDNNLLVRQKAIQALGKLPHPTTHILQVLTKASQHDKERRLLKDAFQAALTSIKAKLAARTTPPTNTTNKPTKR
jgi:HEAT repeat protein